MQGEPGVEQMRAALALGQGLQARLRAQQAFGRVGKAALRFAQARLTKAAVQVERGQQREANARTRGRACQDEAEQVAIGVFAPVRRAVQVMELTHLGETCLQHLLVQPFRNGLQLRCIDAQGHLVHAFTPTPKIVAGVVRVLAFGQPGDGALKRMAVGVDQAWHHAAQARGVVVGGRAVGCDVLPMTACISLEQHRLSPTTLDPRLLTPQPGHGRASKAVSGLPGSRRVRSLACTGTGTSPTAPHECLGWVDRSDA